MTVQLTITDNNAQTFETVLDGQTYTFRIYYNIRQGVWFADVTGPQKSFTGVALVGGQDIFRQYAGRLKYVYVINLSSSFSDPTFDNFVDGFAILKASEAEVIEAAGFVI